MLHKQITLETKNQFEICEITQYVREAVAQAGHKYGLALIYAPHTTAAIRINHNEALLKQDIMKMLYRTIPLDINYAHDFFEIRTQIKAGERSNGHAHVKSFLLGASETVPIVKGQLVLGERQNIFFVELDGPRERMAEILIIGD